jgi:hypothetical protein
MWAIFIEKDINTGQYDNDNPGFWYSEFDTLRKENSPEADRLLALFNARLGVAA